VARPLKEYAEAPVRELRLVPALSPRVTALDNLKGVGIILMLILHAFFDLKTFSPEGHFTFVWIPESAWHLGTRVIGVIFFFSAGISCWLKYHSGNEKTFKDFAQSSTTLFLAAAAVTLGTKLFTPEFIVYFGVLHCLACSRILTYPFLRLRYANLWIGGLILASGFFLRQQEIETRGWIWLGVPSSEGSGGDWYPLIPWLGVSLLGIFAAGEISRRKAAIRIPRALNLPRFVGWLGKHSLAVYLIHQPVFVGAIFLAKKMGIFH